jgi:hypothetical protein
VNPGIDHEAQPSADVSAPTRRGRFFDRLRPLSDRRLAVVLVLCLFGGYWLTMGGHTYSIDDEGYLAGARALAHHTTLLTPTPDIAGTIAVVPHKNGGSTIASPIGTLALFTPGVIAGKIFSIPFPDGSKQEAARLIYLSTNSLLTAMTAGVLFLLCRALGSTRRSALLLAVVFALGTWAWPHSKTGFSEPGTSLMMTSALLALVSHWKRKSLRSAYWVGLFVGCAVITRSSSALFVPILLGAALSVVDWKQWRQLATIAAGFALGGLLPLAAFSINAWLRFGSFLDSGYPPIPFTTAPLEGVFGLLLSPGKGLLWFAPICIVAVFGLRQSFLLQRRYTVVVLLILSAHLAVYARFSVWSGEAAFGPRYLVPLLPAIISLLAPVLDTAVHWRRGAALAGTVGFVVSGLIGGSMYFNAVYAQTWPEVSGDLRIESPTYEQIQVAWQFLPSDSQLGLYLQSVPTLIDNSKDRLAGRGSGMVPVPVNYQERIFWYNSSIQPDYWWAWWSERGDAPMGYFALLVPVFLWGGAWAVVRRGRRLAASPAMPPAPATDDAEETTSALQGAGV